MRRQESAAWPLPGREALCGESRFQSLPTGSKTREYLTPSESGAIFAADGGEAWRFDEVRDGEHAVRRNPIPPLVIAAVGSLTAITRSLNFQNNWKCRLCAVATQGTPLHQRSKTPKKCARLMWVWITSTRRLPDQLGNAADFTRWPTAKVRQYHFHGPTAGLFGNPAPGTADQRHLMAPADELLRHTRQCRTAPLTSGPEAISTMFMLPSPMPCENSCRAQRADHSARFSQDPSYDCVLLLRNELGADREFFTRHATSISSAWEDRQIESKTTDLRTEDGRFFHALYRISACRAIPIAGQRDGAIRPGILPQRTHLEGLLVMRLGLMDIRPGILPQRTQRSQRNAFDPFYESG